MNRPTFIINSGSCNSLVFKLKSLTILAGESCISIKPLQKNRKIHSKIKINTIEIWLDVNLAVVISWFLTIFLIFWHPCCVSSSLKHKTMKSLLANRNAFLVVRIKFHKCNNSISQSALKDDHLMTSWALCQGYRNTWLFFKASFCSVHE